MRKLQRNDMVEGSERNKMNFRSDKVRITIGQDKFSSLPDEIIHHIFSFNDVKYAVQTSVLSSRWKFVWKSLPYLKFAPSEYRTYPKFTKFVNRLVSFRYNHCEVHSLYFCFDGRVNHKFVEKIGSYAMSHNVQKVEIIARSPKSKEQYLYPPCFFSSESLEDLTLRCNSFCWCKYPLPQTPWELPALTTLYIDDMWFRVDSTGCIEMFSKCVNLKNLTIKDCRPMDWALLKIISPRLENLCLIDSLLFNFIILAPNLSSFYFAGNGWHPPFFSTGNLLKLDKVNLQPRFHFSNTSLERPKEDLEKYANSIFSMFQEFRYAKFLTLDSSVIEFLSTVPDVLESQISPFSNLKCLTIEFRQMMESTNSDMIEQVIKYLFNSSSSFNVIMKLPKELTGSANLRWRLLITFEDTWETFRRRDVQQLSQVAEMLSKHIMTDPQIRQVLEAVKEKLANILLKIGSSSSALV